jgi:hypothetical protein
LQNNPDTAVDFLHRSIGRFSTPDADDLKMWDWVMQTVKPDNVIAVLQKAQRQRLKSSNVGQGTFLICCRCPLLTWTSDIVIHQPNVVSPDLESGVENRSSNVMGGFPPFPFHDTNINNLDDHMEDTRSDGSPKVLVTTNTAVHTHDLDAMSSVPSSAAQPPDPAKDVESDMVVDSGEASSWERTSRERRTAWHRRGKSFRS